MTLVLGIIGGNEEKPIISRGGSPSEISLVDKDRLIES
jgi:hypothetical protein